MFGRAILCDLYRYPSFNDNLSRCKERQQLLQSHRTIRYLQDIVCFRMLGPRLENFMFLRKIEMQLSYNRLYRLPIPFGLIAFRRRVRNEIEPSRH